MCRVCANVSVRRGLPPTPAHYVRCPLPIAMGRGTRGEGCVQRPYHWKLSAASDIAFIKIRIFLICLSAHLLHMSPCRLLCNLCAKMFLPLFLHKESGVWGNAPPEQRKVKKRTNSLAHFLQMSVFKKLTNNFNYGLKVTTQHGG